MTLLPPSRSKRLAVLAALLLFGTAACSSGSDEASEAATVADDTTASGTEEAETDEAASDDAATEESSAEGAEAVSDADSEDGEEAADAEDAVDEGGDGGDCLVGEWMVSEAELDGYYGQIETGLEGVAFDITGGTGLTFGADGTYLYTPDFTFEMDADGIVAEGTVTGTLDGTYEVVDGVVETTIVSDDLDITVSAAGITMSASDLGMDLATFAPVASAPVDCSGENPVVMYDLGNGSREPVELTPA